MTASLKSVADTGSGDHVANETAAGSTTSMPSASLSDSPASRQPIVKRISSFSALLAMLLVTALFAALREFRVDPDVWWHIKFGRDILLTHHWPTTETFSFTAPGAPWMEYEWLGDVLLAVADRAWGLRGLMLLDFVLGSAVLLALYGLASLRSHNSKAAFVTCGLFLLLAAIPFNLRPQMLGYLFLTLTLIILERFRQGRRGTLWLLPLLFLVWVNAHGTFVVGLFVFFVYGISGLFKFRPGNLESVLWAPRERVSLGLAFFASLVALTVTPYGPRLVGYVLELIFMRPLNMASIQEWRPMPFDLDFGKLFLALLIGFVLAQVVLRLTWQLPEALLFLVGIAEVCIHVRFLLIFVPFSVPLFAVILSRWIPPYDPGKDKYALNALLMIAVVAGIVLFFPSQAQLESYRAERWPVQTVRYIEQHSLPGPVYNTYGYGGYLDYAFHGRWKVFIDGRTDAYELNNVLADYMNIARVSPDALALLRSYGVQSCLLHRDEPLATLLAASSQWERVYADEQSVIFVRKRLF
jgi:hypothetical protein